VEWNDANTLSCQRLKNSIAVEQELLTAQYRVGMLHPQKEGCIAYCKFLHLDVCVTVHFVGLYALVLTL
jgi:hypothetical protein